MMKRCISLLLVLGIIHGVLAPTTQAAPVENVSEYSDGYTVTDLVIEGGTTTVAYDSV